MKSILLPLKATRPPFKIYPLASASPPPPPTPCCPIASLLKNILPDYNFQGGLIDGTSRKDWIIPAQILIKTSLERLVAQD